MPHTLSSSKVPRVALVILLIGLVGCEAEKPVSYKIPKEDRTVNMPTAVSNSASENKVATETAKSGSTMQVLPGMAEASEQAGGIEYTTPATWTESPPTGIRKANFKIDDANGSAEVTVLVFPGDVGGTLANINRWRGQIGLEPATAESLSSFTESYMISRHRGLYVRIVGTEQAILGGLLPFHGNTWFFKMQGTIATVIEQEAAMKAFLDSVSIEDNHH